CAARLARAASSVAAVTTWYPQLRSSPPIPSKTIGSSSITTTSLALGTSGAIDIPKSPDQPPPTAPYSEGGRAADKSARSPAAPPRENSLGENRVAQSNIYATNRLETGPSTLVPGPNTTAPSGNDTNQSHPRPRSCAPCG